MVWAEKCCYGKGWAANRPPNENGFVGAVAGILGLVLWLCPSLGLGLGERQSLDLQLEEGCHGAPV